MSLLDLQATLAIAAPLAVIIGVIIALLQLRNQNHLRQVEIVMRLYASFGEEEFARHYLRLARWKFKTYNAYRRNHTSEDSVSFFVVGTFFEGMGLLLKRNLVPLDLLDDLLSGPILETWSRVRPIVLGLREELHQPARFEWFEFLYERMKARIEDLSPRSSPRASGPA